MATRERNDDLARHFGENLRRGRRLARMSQEELACRAALHRTEVSFLERGFRVPSIETLLKVAAAVEVREARLLDGVDWIPASTAARGYLCSTPALTRRCCDGSETAVAEGIRRRHSAGCATRTGRRCNCDAGWEASVYVAREKKRITKSFRREAEARRWRVDARRAVERGELGGTPRDGRTLAEALREFVAGMESGTVRPKGRKRYKPNTIRSYERVSRVYVEGSVVGGMKVAEIRRRDLQDFADELLGSGLAAGTVSNVLNPIQAFYRRALDRDELTYNPAERIDLPSWGTKRPKRIASAAEAVHLLAALRLEDRPIWATAFYAGLRRGELQALRVCDVDFETNVVAVERG